jgi:hypothetical protein
VYKSTITSASAFDDVKLSKKELKTERQKLKKVMNITQNDPVTDCAQDDTATVNNNDTAMVTTLTLISAIREVLNSPLPLPNANLSEPTARKPEIPVTPRKQIDISSCLQTELISKLRLVEKVDPVDWFCKELSAEDRDSLAKSIVYI